MRGNAMNTIVSRTKTEDAVAKKGRSSRSEEREEDDIWKTRETLH
jgi:hypothetical protein